MIASLNGIVRSITNDRVVIEVGGVGLSVLTTTQSISQLTIGAPTQLFTSLVVREDSLTLFGFFTIDARNLFELLQSVSGIGPKVALSVLSAFTPEDLSRAIAEEDVATIERTPGIGHKGAQRLILELKGKLTRFSTHQSALNHQPIWREQLMSALVSLGFSPRESDGAISALTARLHIEDRDPASVELSELLKDALATGKNLRG